MKLPVKCGHLTCLLPSPKWTSSFRTRQRVQNDGRYRRKKCYAADGVSLFIIEMVKNESNERLDLPGTKERVSVSP